MEITSGRAVDQAGERIPFLLKVVFDFVALDEGYCWAGNVMGPKPITDVVRSFFQDRLNRAGQLGRGPEDFVFRRTGTAPLTAPATILSATFSRPAAPAR